MHKAFCCRQMMLTISPVIARAIRFSAPPNKSCSNNEYLILTHSVLSPTIPADRQTDIIKSQINNKPAFLIVLPWLVVNSDFSLSTVRHELYLTRNRNQQRLRQYPGRLTPATLRSHCCPSLSSPCPPRSLGPTCSSRRSAPPCCTRASRRSAATSWQPR